MTAIDNVLFFLQELVILVRLKCWLISGCLGQRCRHTQEIVKYEKP